MLRYSLERVRPTGTALSETPGTESMARPLLLTACSVKGGTQTTDSLHALGYVCIDFGQRKCTQM